MSFIDTVVLRGLKTALRIWIHGMFNHVAFTSPNFMSLGSVGILYAWKDLPFLLKKEENNWWDFKPYAYIDYHYKYDNKKFEKFPSRGLLCLSLNKCFIFIIITY